MTRRHGLKKLEQSDDLLRNKSPSDGKGERIRSTYPRRPSHFRQGTASGQSGEDQGQRDVAADFLVVQGVQTLQEEETSSDIAPKISWQASVEVSLGET